MSWLKAERGQGVLTLLILLQLYRCAGPTHALTARRTSRSEATLIEIAGETMDTAALPSVLHIYRRAGVRKRYFANETFSQYYVQFTPAADVQAFIKSTGVMLTAYVPNNAYIVLASGARALEIAALDGVQWVGRRPSRHKVSLSLTGTAVPRKSRTTGPPRGRKMDPTAVTSESMEAWTRKWVLSLLITVHTPREWAAAKLADESSGGGEADLGRSANFAGRCMAVLTASGVGVLDVFHASEEKVVMRVRPDALRDALEWLSEQPEAIWIEEQRTYYPFMAGATRLVTDGPSPTSEESDFPSTQKMGIDGTGEIIGIADTGLDWDSCFFWESKQNKLSLKEGVEPPFQNVIQSRRKLISYNWHDKCEVCNRCPVDVEDDYYVFVTSNGEIEGQKTWRRKFPLTDDNSAANPPRNYNSAGATVTFDLTAVTTNAQSIYGTPGAGAYDIKINLQLFVVPRASLDSFDPNKPEHVTACSTASHVLYCSESGNQLKSERVVLRASDGGYGVVIANRGVVRQDGESVNAKVIVKGRIQFQTALKPCGDKGDDRVGHGTHTSAVAAGAVYTPNITEYEKAKTKASLHNGMAPGAKIYFQDVQQNAHPDCNEPGKACERVNDLTVPIDLAKNLFLDPYNAGARIHLNSWGCRAPDTATGANSINETRPASCNKYSVMSRDVDKFVHEHPDFLIIFAAGENGRSDEEGSIAEPGTCKNCLTIGMTHTFHKRYREAARMRDPQADICGIQSVVKQERFPLSVKGCQHPYFCSRSDAINKKTITDRSTRDEEMAKLHKCCNDTLHDFFSVVDAKVNRKQWFTVHLPNMTYQHEDLSARVDDLKWFSQGASIIFDFKAERDTVGQATGIEAEPGIQVFLLHRKDFAEYFEENTNAERANPCITDETKQVSGEEQCMSRTDQGFEPIDRCSEQDYDYMEITKWNDEHCHRGNCKRLEQQSDKREKDNTDEGKWGRKISDGCADLSQQCCNDQFLRTMCLNNECTTIKNRVHGIFRHLCPLQLQNRHLCDLQRPTPSTITELNKKGFGVAVRNMNAFPIKLTGRIEIRNKEYPCTLTECCDDTMCAEENFFVGCADCCANKYPGKFGAGQQCSQCPLTPTPGACQPNDANNIPDVTSRGPGMSDYIKKIGGRQFKPELVAPGFQIVSANSDGFVPSVGKPVDLQVQCGLPTTTTVDKRDFFCHPTSSEPYDNTTALDARSGSSIAAAVIAGSAALIRQYLRHGYYPTGLKNESNKVFSNPSAALVKGMLINSARSVQGSTNTYTYKYPPFCDPAQEVCKPWTKPQPEECKLDSTFFSGVDCYVRRDAMSKTPSNIEGYGRPVLRNVIWTNESTYSLYIDETFVPGGWQRTYSLNVLEISPQNPIKITVVWTDEPGTPESKSTLVNDLDLIVQLASTETLYNPNQGVSSDVDIFETYYGNGGGQTGRDRTNVVEEVTITTPKRNINMTIVVLGFLIPKFMTTANAGQKFSLIITGQLKNKYEKWSMSRSTVLDFIDQNSGGITDDREKFETAFSFLDIFKDLLVSAEEIKLRMPSIPSNNATEMVQEADDNKDGAVDIEEFVKAVLVARSQARVPLPPSKDFTRADASLLADKNKTEAVLESKACKLVAPQGNIKIILTIAIASFCFSSRVTRREA